MEATLKMIKVDWHVDWVSSAPLTGDAVLIEKCVADNLTIFTEHQTEKIEGEGLVAGLLIKDLKTGESKRLEVTGVFIEIGLEPNSDAVSELVKLNRWREVPVTPTCETEIPGLSAAGDVTDGAEQ